VVGGGGASVAARARTQADSRWRKRGRGVHRIRHARRARAGDQSPVENFGIGCASVAGLAGPEVIMAKRALLVIAALAALAANARADEERPGLLATYSDARHRVVLPVPSPNFYLNARESLHPALAP